MQMRRERPRQSCDAQRTNAFLFCRRRTPHDADAKINQVARVPDTTATAGP
jgi:hypothetical protein